MILECNVAFPILETNETTGAHNADLRLPRPHHRHPRHPRRAHPALDAGTACGRISNALKNTGGTPSLTIHAATAYGDITARSL
jgi:hypothetical protein